MASADGTRGSGEELYEETLREFAELNGLNPELEPRHLLMKATGLLKTRAALCDERYGEIQRMKAEAEAMRPRLMPEGCEWPRYDTGEQVRFGNEFLDHQGNVRSVLSVKMFQEGGFEIGTGQGTYDWHSAGERVRRPAVLAADGEPVRGGETLYLAGSVREITVSTVEPGCITDTDGDEWAPGDLTHEKPVLAADGEPLEVGQTVWDANGDEFRVLGLYGSPVDEDFPDHTVRCRRAGAEEYESTMCVPSQLTHQRPVLDADGVPIREGDTVWCVATDDELTDMSIIRACWSKMREKLTVKSFITDVHGDKWADFEETLLCVKTCYLTHKRPVLDAGGVPIKVGDTVWDIETGIEFEVSEIVGCAVTMSNGAYYSSVFHRYCPSKLTHTKPEPPDSWERLKADIYREIETDKGMRLASEFVEAIVRRCKALAGVSE